MAIYESDNPEILELLHKLEKLILEGGGYISDNAVVRCKNNDLSVFSNAAENAGEELAATPEKCLIPFDSFNLFIEGDDICIRDSKLEVSNLQWKLFEVMLAIYNKTGKLASYRLSSPWIVCRNSLEILDKIIAGRKDTPGIKALRKKAKRSLTDEELLENFFHTRVLNFKGNKEKGNYKIIMPFIDFLNHHPMGSPYRNKSEHYDGMGIAVKTKKCVEGSDESFAFYGMYDTYDLFLNYTYVSEDVMFARSVPLIVDLGELGVIEIGSRTNAHFRKNLPEKIKDLRFFLPRIIKRDGNNIKINQIIIPPPQSPRALRRILGILIRQINPRVNPAIVQAVVPQAELEILKANIVFYKNLLEYLDTVDDESVGLIKENAQKMARRQIEIIENHKQRVSAL